MIPLVLVHGFMGGSAQWQAQAPLGEDRPLIALDLPGFGENAHLPAIDRIEEFAAWALAALTQQGCARFDLLGHSMGGMVVQEMVHQAPDRVANLVLYGTGSQGVLPGRFETIETSKARARQDGPRATARRIAATWFHKGDASPGYAACAAIAEMSSPAAIDAGLDAMQAWSGADRLGAIKSPTLILWGEHDRSYPWSQIERLWRQIPETSLAVMPGCAHAMHLERPELFNALVSGFLQPPDV